MKKVTNLSSRVFMVLCAALLLSGVLASSTQAQAARPLDDVLEDWQGYDWDWIVDVAGWEAQNDGPLYPSAPPTVPQYETFEGDFMPEDGSTKIAIFSDDGCDVYINGVKVHANLNHGQGLPDLSQSLRKIPYDFQGGTTYQIKVVYSNTFYTGQTDIDGASLFAYSAAAPPPTDPRNWTIGTGISGGSLMAPVNGVQGVTDSEIQCAVTEAIDQDHWTRGGDAGDETDKVGYQWSARDSQGNDVGGFEDNSNRTATWTVPSLPGSYVLSCVIDDWPDDPPGQMGVVAPDTGNRNDPQVVREVTVVVTGKVWQATWLEDNVSRGQLGYNKIDNSVWVENGRLIAPQDQRTAQPWTEVSVSTGATLSFQTEDATDSDRWVQGDENGIETDDITYAWTATGGTFSGNTHQTKATWQAPNAVGDYTVTCTVDDVAPLPLGEGGSRNDDPPLTRSVLIHVVEGPRITWSGDIVTNGTVRACAGGVDDHDARDTQGQPDAQYRAHTRLVTAQVTYQGQPANGIPVEFEFEGNRGHEYQDGRDKLTARLHDPATSFTDPANWKETDTRSGVTNGSIGLWIKSSDIISRATLKAFWTDGAGHRILIGSIGCDFAESVTMRRFANALDPEENGDTGWLFIYPQLSAPGSTAPAKAYLKFMKDKDQPDADGNWNFVNGHRLLLRVEQAVLTDNNQTVVTGMPPDLKPYAFMTSSNQGQSDPDELVALRVTSGQGETIPQAYVNAGQSINQVAEVYLVANDASQWAE